MTVYMVMYDDGVYGDVHLNIGLKWLFSSVPYLNKWH